MTPEQHTDLAKQVADAIYGHAAADQAVTAVMRVVAPLLDEADAAAEFNWNSYHQATQWHLAMAIEIKRLDGSVPQSAPGLPEIVTYLAKIHGADKVRAALDAL